MTFSFLRLNTDWTSLTLCLGCMWSTSHYLKKPVSLYLFPNFFYSFTFLNVVQEKAEKQKLILHNLRLSQVGPPPPGWDTCLCHMADTRGSCDPGFFFISWRKIPGRGFSSDDICRVWRTVRAGVRPTASTGRIKSISEKTQSIFLVIPPDK